MVGRKAFGELGCAVLRLQSNMTRIYHAFTDIYFNAFRADIDKHVQVLEIATIAFHKFSHAPPLIWAQIVRWRRRRRRAQTSGCFCNADLPVWLHSKRDAAKSGIAKLLLLLQTHF